MTDHHARDLLRKAAETIEVESAPTALGRSTTSGWARPVAAAVAAVLVIVGIALGANRLLSGDPEPPVPAGPPVEQPYDFASNQVPGLLGYTLEEATAELDARDLRVETRPLRDGCRPPGIVAGVAPGQGATVRPGDTVTLRVSTMVDVFDCVGEAPWEAIYALVRFARGLDDAPPVTDGVRLTVDGVDPVELTAAEARDPEAWTVCVDDGRCHSALGALQQMLTTPVSAAGSVLAPELVAGQGIQCPGKAGSVSLTVTTMVDPGPGSCPLPAVSLDLEPDDFSAVAAVDVQTATSRSSASEPLRAQQMAAEQFVAWARDRAASPPPFADGVAVRTADGRRRTYARDDVLGRNVFPPCSGFDGDSCGLSPLAILRERGESLAFSTLPVATCGSLRDDSGRMLQATVEGRLLSITPAAARTCGERFAVELIFDDDGEIIEVNTFPGGVAGAG